MSTDFKTVKNDVGVDFEVVVDNGSTIVDIGAATALAIEFRKPGGATVEVAAVLVSDGTDGALKYRTLAAGELDALGEWSYRGKVTFGATQVFHSDPPKLFTVIA